MKKRVVNYRPLVFILLALMLGIFSAKLFLDFGNILWIAISVLLCTTFTLLILSQNFKGKFFVYLNTYKIVIMICMAIYLLGMFLFNYAYFDFNNHAIAEGDYTVSGRVTDSMVEDSNRLEIVLEDTTAFTSTKEIELDGNVRINLYFSDDDNIDIKTGDEVLFFGYMYEYNLLNSSGDINSYVHKNNLKYFSNVSVGDIAITSYDDIKFDENFRLSVKNILDSNLSSGSSDISYAMIFGDKSELDGIIYNAFKDSGVAHILAVSGLHIGVFVVFLMWLLTLLKVNKKVSFVILAVVLLLYVYLCGFSASVVRASIMSLALILAYVLGERNDSLSALSLAGIVILLLNPISMFYVGFLLSFASVYAIILLYKPINKYISKLKMPVYVTSTIAVTLAVQLGTLPIMAIYFNQISIFSVLTNLLIMPLFVVAYISLLIAVGFALIIPAFGFLLSIPAAFVNVIFIVCSLIAGISFANLSLPEFSAIASVLFYVMLFCLSGYLMIKLKPKLIVTLVLCVGIIASVGIYNTEASFKDDYFMAMAETVNANIITSEGGEVYLIGVGDGSDWDVYNIEKYLQNKKIENLDGIVLTNYTQVQEKAVCYLAENYSAEKVILPKTSDIAMFGLATSIYDSDVISEIDEGSEYVYSDIIVTTHMREQESIALKVQIAGKDFIFIKPNASSDELSYINYNVSLNVDYLVIDMFDDNVPNNFYNAGMIIMHYGKLGYHLVNSYEIYKLGDFTLSL